MRTHTHTWMRELEVRTVAGQHTDPVGLHRAGAYVHGPQPYGVELVLIKYWVDLYKKRYPKNNMLNDHVHN